MTSWVSCWSVKQHSGVALAADAGSCSLLQGGLPAASGARLELAPADISQAATLQPQLFKGVRAVVSCTAVKVVPKEGDTGDRQKYMQGIKFYDPEIVGDTPETVEYVGVRNLVEAVQQQLGTEQGKVGAAYTPHARLLTALHACW